MALEKSISQPQGFDATYWMIGSLTVEKKNKTVTIIMHGYKDQQTRNSNPHDGILAESRHKITGGDDFDTLWQTVVINKNKRAYEAVYDHIKTLPRYQGATDILE